MDAHAWHTHRVSSMARFVVEKKVRDFFAKFTIEKQKALLFFAPLKDTQTRCNTL